MAIKPNVIIWPIVLLVAGAPAAGIASFVVAGGLSLLALLLLGPGVYIQWLDASAKTLATVAQAPLSMSFTMVTTRLGLPWLGTLLSVAVVAGVVWWAWRYKPNLHDAGSAALSASIVAAPVAWPGYTLLLLPAFLTRRLPSRLWRASAVGLVMPFALVDVIASHLPWLGSKLGAVYTLSLLAVLIAVCRPPRALRPPGQASARPRSGENTQAVTKSP